MRIGKFGNKKVQRLNDFGWMIVVVDEWEREEWKAKQKGGGELIQEWAGRTLVDRDCRTEVGAPLVIAVVMRSVTKSRQEKSVCVTTIETGLRQGQEMAGKVILIIHSLCNLRTELK